MLWLFMASVEYIQSAILRWYGRNSRTLPWRESRRTVYHVWLSEVMLQQTTVTVVIPYFRRFIAAFPTVQALAAASRDDMLLLWQGLGYYGRAHRLHETARIIVHERNGRFPRCEKEWLALPGIGRYTAAAIMAIAFNRRAVVVDGNVRRVVTRLFAHDRVTPLQDRWLYRMVARLTPHNECAAYVQAMMDFGATICKPHMPLCDCCPLQKICRAYDRGAQSHYPVLPTKRARPHLYGLFFVCRNDEGAILLERRKDTGLLAGTMLLPSTPWRDTQWTSTSPSQWQAHAPQARDWRLIAGTVQHVFTHFSLEARIMEGRNCQEPHHAVWMLPQQQEQFPFSSLMRRLLNHWNSHIS